MFTPHKHLSIALQFQIPRNYPGLLNGLSEFNVRTRYYEITRITQPNEGFVLTLECESEHGVTNDDM